MTQRSVSFPTALPLFASMAFLFVLGGSLSAAMARDASFMDPGAATGNASPIINNGTAITVEPHSEIDIGESNVGVARRTTLFFVNQTSLPIGIVSIVANSDGNVASTLMNDDCSKQKTIGLGSQCSLVVEAVPSSPGPWSVEVLMTHEGSGRIARARISGKASGQAVVAERHDDGLLLSTKDTKPIDFGDVDPNGASVVRSALMVNDSPDPITIESIDVIAAGNGLTKLDQGCLSDTVLKPGGSCPVTLLWKPTAHGKISTDLIIRHTGRLGFAVVPLRGNAGSEKEVVASLESKDLGKTQPPPLPTEVEKAVIGKIPPLLIETPSKVEMAPIPKRFEAPVKEKPPEPKPLSDRVYQFHLIGTVGDKAILLTPEGDSLVVGLGEDIPYGDNLVAKLTAIAPKEAEIFFDGRKKRFALELSSALANKASASHASAKTEPGATGIADKK